MITYLEGTIISIYDDRVTLVVNGVGYEVLIPMYAIGDVKRAARTDESPLGLYISYNQTERQPKPVLVGFRTEVDRDFFEIFISVEDIGPMAAVKALVRPVGEIARHIEEKDTKSLQKLKGIGARKAEKIVATLKGKVAKYALIREREDIPGEMEDFQREVEMVLVDQLGYKTGEARKMVEEAMIRNPSIATSEELFHEVYRGQRR